MAILTVYTKLLDKTLEGARIIDMGSTKSCECFVLPRDMVAEVGGLSGHYCMGRWRRKEISIGVVEGIRL